MATNPSCEERAAQHAQEAERLLAKRLGWLNDTLNAQVHATLAVYYSAEAAKEETPAAH
jgi:hypothetical protein